MIEQNIIQKTKRFEVDNMVFGFNFTMYSLGLLMEEFSIESLDDLVKKVCSPNQYVAIMTAMQILYVSLEVEKEISFREFLKAFETIERLEQCLDFVWKNLEYFLTPKKKLNWDQLAETMFKVKNMDQKQVLTLTRSI